MFIEKGVLKSCSEFAGEYPYRTVISIKLLCKFTEIALRYGFSPVNLVYIYRTPFYKKAYAGLLLNTAKSYYFEIF